jgi:acyl-CoA thioesterase FadM
VVAKNELNYQLPVVYGDHVEIETKCSHLGSKSLTLSSMVYKMVKGKRVLCAHGHCVLVCFNHRTQLSHEIPSHWRVLLEQEISVSE